MRKARWGVLNEVEQIERGSCGSEEEDEGGGGGGGGQRGRMKGGS